MHTTTVAALPVADALEMILTEDARLVARLREEGPAALDDASAALSAARRVFVLGAGRSGLALRMTAMRLMHLGLAVHVVGDVTTPAIAAGDVLLVASGSGTTAGIVRSAETAAASGAVIVVLTTDPLSPLAALAQVVIRIPAAAKQDHAGVISGQYSGSLFEQVVVVVGDALFHSLWVGFGASAEELWPRHSNLE